MNKTSLPIQIVAGILAAFILGILYITQEWDPTYILFYTKPLGISFINSLKIIAVPMIFTSIVASINNTKTTNELHLIALKTCAIYISTTLIATFLGLSLANLIQFRKICKKFDFTHTPHIPNPTSALPTSTDAFIPVNLFKAISDNQNLLFIVCFALLFGITSQKLTKEKREIISTFFAAINDTFIHITNFIMHFAPIGAFALTLSVLIEQTNNKLSNISSLLKVVACYAATVLFSLAIMVFIIYPLFILFFSKVSPRKFLQAIQPAQLVALSTSSSSATLPVTIDCTKRLGVSEEICNLVLPIGATINMNGTVINQAISVIFVTQLYGIDLSISNQLFIAAYIAILSLGIAALPGTSLGITSLLFLKLNLPPEAISPILLVDRLLDMFRSATNVSGDICAAIIANQLKSER